MVEKGRKFGDKKENIYICDTKTILFNLELLPFMNLKEAGEFYKIIKDKFSTKSRFENFFVYFEDN